MQRGNRNNNRMIRPNNMFQNRSQRPISRRLYISNLNSTFTNYELQRIFSELGNLQRCGIFWDRLGNSKGTAIIEYDSVEAAREAIRRFNNTSVGRGQRMQVEYANRRQPMWRKEGLRLGGRRKFNNY